MLLDLVRYGKPGKRVPVVFNNLLLKGVKEYTVDVCIEGEVKDLAESMLMGDALRASLSGKRAKYGNGVFTPGRPIRERGLTKSKRRRTAFFPIRCICLCKRNG